MEYCAGANDLPTKASVPAASCSMVFTSSAMSLKWLSGLWSGVVELQIVSRLRVVVTQDPDKSPFFQLK